MSFFDSFLGGAAESGAGIIGNQIKSDQDMARQTGLAKLQEELAVQRAQTIQDMTNDNANTLRQQKVSNIQTQLGENADTAVGKQFSGVDPLPQTDGDGNPLTDEAKQAYTQGVGLVNGSMDKAKEAYSGSAMNQLKASVDAGYTDPTVMAQIDSRNEIAAAKNAGYMDKLQYLTDKSDKDRASKELLATLRTIGGSGSADKESAKMKTANSYLDSVNAERKKTGDDPISFEEAYNIANYAPRPDQDMKSRQALAKTVLETNPKLAADPVALSAAVDGLQSAVQGQPKSQKVAMPMPTSKATLVANQVYQTPRGPATWDGTKFNQ